MKKNVLITAGGTATSWYIVNSIKKYFEDFFNIYVCDINPAYLIPASRLALKYLQVPSIGSTNYFSNMIDIFDKYNIDILVPLIDYDLKYFPHDLKELTEKKIVSTAPNEKTVKLCTDKRIFAELCLEKNIPVPSFVGNYRDAKNQKYFIKPRNGYGSMDAREISRSEIETVDLNQYIVQEFCYKPEVTVDVFCYNSKVYTIARERLLVKAGVCNKARVYQDKELHQIIEKIAHNIQLPVASNIQFMKDEQNQWKITDFNLRMGAGTALSSCAGWNLAAAALCVWGNLPFNPLDFLGDVKTEKYAVRVFQEYLMN